MADSDEELAKHWYDEKTALMEKVLGKEYHLCSHAFIPYAIGGALDLYYFPNGIPGTAIATKELSELPGQGSSNRVFRSYELVMFTRHHIDLDAACDESTPFGRVHERIKLILNCIARYSEQATLNPTETCEFPEDIDIVGGRCLILDGYPSYSVRKRAKFGLMAIIEVFRSEMEYARRRGGAKLLKFLKEKGHYPYSDLERKPVV